MSRYNLSRLSVLVVEDNKYMRKIVHTILEAMGITDVNTVDNPIDAIERIRDYRPDIMITDWMMEPINGIELVRAIRDEEKSPDPFLPIILLTGHAEKDLVLQARDVGVHEVLTKPISIGALYKRIVTLVEHPRPFVRRPDYFGPEPRQKPRPAA